MENAKVIIGVDGTCLQGTRTGTGWYLTRLLEALSHILEEDKIYVWMNNPTPEERARVSENRFVALNATHYPWAALKLTWNTLGTPSAESLIGRPADVYFYPNHYSLPQKQGKRVYFVHDLAYMAHPELSGSFVPKSLGARSEKLEEKANLVLTDSNYNRQEILGAYPRLPESRIRVIPHGLSDSFRNPVSREAVQALREKYKISRPLFLVCRKIGASEKPPAHDPFFPII